MRNRQNKNCWYALYTKPRSEFKAKQQLELLDIDYYLPIITKTKQWRDRKKEITEPLIRGYIFICADEKQRLESLEQTSIVRCVFESGHPARIPNWQIENIKIMLNGEPDLIVQNGIIPGAKVRIKEGPLKDVVGVVINSEKGKSISVSFDLLNRSVITRLPERSALELVKDS
jgi:transcription antitermination factor NusG